MEEVELYLVVNESGAIFFASSGEKIVAPEYYDYKFTVSPSVADAVHLYRVDTTGEEPKLILKDQTS